MVLCCASVVVVVFFFTSATKDFKTFVLCLKDFVLNNEVLQVKFLTR